MENGRRWFLSSIVAALAGAESLFAGLQRRSRVPPFPQIPDASQPYGSRRVEPMPKPDPKALLKENQKKLRLDVDRLVELAAELKKEADETDQTDVLSLSLIRKAEEIEKLARQIKSLARSA